MVSEVLSSLLSSKTVHFFEAQKRRTFSLADPLSTRTRKEAPEDSSIPLYVAITRAGQANPRQSISFIT
jgi:hypothetical protein